MLEWFEKRIIIVGMRRGRRRGVLFGFGERRMNGCEDGKGEDGKGDGFDGRTDGSFESLW